MLCSARRSVWLVVVGLTVLAYICVCSVYVAAFSLPSNTLRQHERQRVINSVLGLRASVCKKALVEPLNEVLAQATEGDDATAELAYKTWAEQFPIAAARQDFYQLSCSRLDVKARFLFVAKALGTSTEETFEIFRPDLWILGESSEKVVEKLDILRSMATEQEILEFLRAAPRSIATTTPDEIRDRGLSNMLFRSNAGAVFEFINFPVRAFFFEMAKDTAKGMTSRASSGEVCSEEDLAKEAKRDTDERKTLGFLLFGSLFSLTIYAGYMDATYGGPIHGKGLCPASPIPTFNIPDAEGNTRLPCNCAPIYKWYIEPALSEEQREKFLGLRPDVASKNCGRQMGGEKKACDPTTVGGCVWTASDLEQDPSVWDHFGRRTYWEQQRQR